MNKKQEQSGRKEEIFDGALQLEDPSERSSYLDLCCANAPELRREIEALLAAHDEAEGFFADGATLVNGSQAFARVNRHRLSDETIGARIGRYKLVKRIGHGGCGVVYLAEQEEPVRRPVALKIIRLGMETKNVIARFESERQALAMMDHPNIARVFDAGETARGAPYFVMEHVFGTRITDYCDQNKLTVRQRLELFIQVCHAIQHAHQKGVIHGDIKPSNIMIAQHDGVPVPKVIDFGISRVTDVGLSERLLFTSSDQMIGTPAYMSPEQVAMSGLDVDTRSDIYSLGVLLFELLTGSTPFDDEQLLDLGLEQMRSVLQEQTPPLPSSKLGSLERGAAAEAAAFRQLSLGKLQSTLRGDLDCIVMKALERDRRRRYETANALAMDIERYMGNEPVLAHSSGWLYSFSKLVRRNKGVFLASGAVAATLICGMGMSTWLLIKEREARQRAVAAEQQQARLRHEAESREQVTQAALMVSQERYGEADAILNDVVLDQPTMEGAAVLRSVGEWHAINGRWSQAAERFDMLLQINDLEGADVSSLDYLEHGPALIELGDIAAYERFRRGAVERFAQSPFADRIVKISLLTPAPASFIVSLEDLAAATAAAADEAAEAGDGFQAAWRSMSMALYAYRKGDYLAAADWATRCLSYPGPNAPRDTTARLILAMCHYRSGRLEEAKETLAVANAAMERYESELTGRGTPVQGFWFDWAFARVIWREALALLDGNAL